MTISDILSEIKNTAGSNDKKVLLQEHGENSLLKKALKYGMDPFMPFNIVKVPKVKERFESSYEDKVWNRFFETADACAERKITGNKAIEAMHHVFSTSPEDDEKWMRKRSVHKVHEHRKRRKSTFSLNSPTRDDTI